MKRNSIIIVFQFIIIYFKLNQNQSTKTCSHVRVLVIVGRNALPMTSRVSCVGRCATRTLQYAHNIICTLDRISNQSASIPFKQMNIIAHVSPTPPLLLFAKWIRRFVRALSTQKYLATTHLYDIYNRSHKISQT